MKKYSDKTRNFIISHSLGMKRLKTLLSLTLSLILALFAMMGHFWEVRNSDASEIAFLFFLILTPSFCLTFNYFLTLISKGLREFAQDRGFTLKTVGVVTFIVWLLMVIFFAQEVDCCAGVRAQDKALEYLIGTAFASLIIGVFLYSMAKWVLAGFKNDKIRCAIKTNFKNHKTDELVLALFQANGFLAQKKASEETNVGSVIFLYNKNQNSKEPQLREVIKINETTVGDKEYQELKDLMKSSEASYGLLISWGGFCKSVEYKARENPNIRLWTLDILAEKIQENYQKFPVEIQKKITF